MDDIARRPPGQIARERSTLFIVMIQLAPARNTGAGFCYTNALPTMVSSTFSGDLAGVFIADTGTR